MSRASACQGQVSKSRREFNNRLFHKQNVYLQPRLEKSLSSVLSFVLNGTKFPSFLIGLTDLHCSFVFPIPETKAFDLYYC